MWFIIEIFFSSLSALCRRNSCWIVHNGHPAIPLLNELLLTQIDFRITGHRCVGIWVVGGGFWFISGFFCLFVWGFLIVVCYFSFSFFFPLKTIVSLHFHFSFQACWNSSIPVIANVIQPCELWLILKDYTHFPPWCAPILLLFAVCGLPAASRGQGDMLLQSCLASLLPASCCI